MYVLRRKSDGKYYQQNYYAPLSFSWVEDPFAATQFDNESVAKLKGDSSAHGDYEVVELRSLINDAGKSSGG